MLDKFWIKKKQNLPIHLPKTFEIKISQMEVNISFKWIPNCDLPGGVHVFGVENAVGAVPEVFAKLCWSFHAPPPAGMFCGGGSAGGGGGRSTAKVCGDFFSYHFGENVTFWYFYIIIEYVYI